MNKRLINNLEKLNKQKITHSEHRLVKRLEPLVWGYVALIFANARKYLGRVKFDSISVIRVTQKLHSKISVINIYILLVASDIEYGLFFYII